MSERRSPLPPLADPVIVDLFAGPGGLDVGAHWLDVPSIGIELNESAVDTREAAGLTTVEGDVTALEPSDFSESVNVLTGGPPCQTFTVAGNGHGRRALDEVLSLVDELGEGGPDAIESVLAKVAGHSDPRTGLVLQPLIWTLRAFDAGRPYEAIMLEQVPAVKPVWHAMHRVLKTIEYGVDVEILRTEEYGVPQTRRRAILIARRGFTDEEVWLPEPTHQKYRRTSVDSPLRLDLGGGLPRWVSMAEALRSPEGFTVWSNYGTGGDPKRRCERRHDLPAFTVTGKVSRNRLKMDRGGEKRFSAQEAGLLQTFPEDYPWSGADVSQQIGNAIPPRLGAHVLAALLGRTDVIEDGFFDTRRDHWSEPSQEVARGLAAAIVSERIKAESTRRHMCAPPDDVARSGHASVVGVEHGSASIDAVEQRTGHEAGAPGSVGVAS